MEDDPYDVVDCHHQKNQPPKLPAPFTFRLNSLAKKEEKPQRAPCNSRTKLDDRHNNPRQMQFYPAPIQEILEGAKVESRLWLVMNYAFPKLKDCKTEIADCLA